MIDHSKIKLGKLPATHDPRTLMLASYTQALPPAPPVVGYLDKVPSWPMMANDRLGDCVIAGMGHSVQEWTTVNGAPVVLTDEQIIAEYSAITGYNPSNPDSDQGTNELQALKYWRSAGIAGHKITAFMALQPKSKTDIMESIWLFGSAFFGIDLPLSAQRQTVWAVPPGGAHGNGAPGSWGGHCVIGVQADAKGVSLITWGSVKRCTWEFLAAYASEAYALLSTDWIAKNGQAPSGFNVTQLQQDLAAL